MCSSDLFALSGEYTTLPSDFQGVKTIKYNSDPQLELEFATTKVFNATYLSSDTTNSPTAYTIEGGYLRVGANASATDTVDLVYYATPDNLTTIGSGQNWICTYYPMVYLYGALRHLGTYIGMDARLGFFQSAFISQLSSLHSKEKSIAFSGVSLQSRTLGVTPT